MSAQLIVSASGGAAVRFELADGERHVIGRSEDADCRVESEPYLGRKHVEISLEGGFLRVSRLPDAANPVYFGGEKRDTFQLASGEYFIIGDTRFEFMASGEAPRIEEHNRDPFSQGTLKPEELYAISAVSDRLRLLDLFELPEILRAKKDPKALYLHVAGLLRMATGARWTCILDADGKVLAQDSMVDASRFQVSRSLVDRAKKDCPQPTFYCWSDSSQDTGATAVEGVDWAVCAATETAEGEALCFYAAGGAPGCGDSSRVHRDNARFVGLVADIVGRTVRVDHLQVWQSRLERFFSAPIVSKILKSRDLADLEPQLCESTIMFFDIRGFSKKTEEMNERVLAYMSELRRVMSVMTQLILDEQGVVLDYIGDAILACWNVPFKDPHHVDKACRAALKMVSAMEAVTDGWRCGIGIHTGKVVAGAVGSEQIFSYSVMGKVVNQASRVEGITKIVETQILVTQEVADRLSKKFAVPLRIGRFEPAGMNAALDLFELMPPPGDAKRAELFAKALAAFEKGDWENAYDALDGLPSGDRPARYLKSLAEHNRRHPPKQWDGVIELSQK